MWTGTPTATLRWLLGPTAISGGATGLTYVLTAADLDVAISVRATATNAGGSAVSTSAAVGPEEAPVIITVPAAIRASDWSLATSPATGRAASLLGFAAHAAEPTTNCGSTGPRKGYRRACGGTVEGTNASFYGEGLSPRVRRNLIAR